LRRWQVAVLILALVLIGVVVLWLISMKTAPQVGAFYYAWYDPASNVSWEYPKIQDKPVLGYYNSCDPSVIEQHFAWLSDLHVDFVVVSWWGIDNQWDWRGSFINNATLQIFQVARDNATNVKVAVMVEPFNESGTYNFEIYDYIYGLVEEYPTVYFNVDGKPLLCFFNGEKMTSPDVFVWDDRFTVKIVGNDNHAEWLYDCVTTKNNPTPPTPRDRQISVSPRFDDFYVRPNNETVDAKLEYLYAEQWQKALDYAKQNAIDFITITSWNEYPERTAIEPHYDATASNQDPYYLCNMTKDYIRQVHLLGKCDYLFAYSSPSLVPKFPAQNFPCPAYWEVFSKFDFSDCLVGGDFLIDESYDFRFSGFSAFF